MISYSLLKCSPNIAPYWYGNSACKGIRQTCSPKCLLNMFSEVFAEYVRKVLTKHVRKYGCRTCSPSMFLKVFAEHIRKHVNGNVQFTSGRSFNELFLCCIYVVSLYVSSVCFHLSCVHTSVKSLKPITENDVIVGLRVCLFCYSFATWWCKFVASHPSRVKKACSVETNSVWCRTR